MREIFLNGVFLSSCLAVTFICMTASLWGTFLLLGRRSMLPETLSHAAYPGLLIGVLCSDFFSSRSTSLACIIIIGCFAAIMGYYSMVLLEVRFKMKEDSALCFVLVSYFAAGVLIASLVRDRYPLIFSRVNAYLYGQAATLGELEAWMGFFIFVTSAISVRFFYRYLMIFLFDQEYAKTCGISSKFINFFILIFVSLVTVAGVRSVGVILISSMFVAPALTARQLSDDLGKILCLSAVIGGISGALGSFLSVTLSQSNYIRVILPTGPVIVILAGIFVMIGLLFSPCNGPIFRKVRGILFRIRRTQEHFLKLFWYVSRGGIEEFSCQDLVHSHKYKEYFDKFSCFTLWMRYFLWKGILLEKRKGVFMLSVAGKLLAERLIRLHRLWEAYMVSSLEFSEDEVHEIAEEAEHVLTTEMEADLTILLNNPEVDPHNKVIPARNKKER